MTNFQKWWRENKEDTNQKITLDILKQLNLTSSAEFFLSQIQSLTLEDEKLKEEQLIDEPLLEKTSYINSDTISKSILSSIGSTITTTETTTLNRLSQITSATSNFTPNKIFNNAIKILNNTLINEFESDEESSIIYDDDNNNDSNDGNNWISSGSLLVLVIIYGIIVFGGVLGNASLVITLCSQSSVKLRNPLLVALCIADLLVAGISAPSTIVTLALTQKAWTLPSFGCKAIYYFQSMPVAASTLSFLMLSLDRYAAVKHPRLAQLRQRRYVHIMLATFSWIGACAICIPILLAYKITNFTTSTIVSSTTTTTTPTVATIVTTSGIIIQDIGLVATKITLPSTTTTATTNQIPNSLRSTQHQIMYTTCRPDYGSNELRTSFIIVHTALVFIFPGLGVILNHYGVRRKLCALSLTARAAHGELPLPMPILRRPTHMIIVTGMANAARGVVSDDSSDNIDKNNDQNDGAKNCHKNDDNNGDDDDDDDNDNNANGGASDEINNKKSKTIHKNKVETIIKTHPKSPRVMREIRIQQRQKLHHNNHFRHHHHHHHHNQHNQGKVPAPELPLPQTSTLRARRRLANLLMAAAIIFVGCWTPHVFCILWTEFNNEKQYCSKTISYFSLLLGYTHSAISPIMYWTLNYNTLRQSSCAPFVRFAAIQRFFRTHLRPQAAPPPPSSTNEAALGAFNPRYIKTTPKQYRAQASSHYLY